MTVMRPAHAAHAPVRSRLIALLFLVTASGQACSLGTADSSSETSEPTLAETPADAATTEETATSPEETVESTSTDGAAGLGESISMLTANTLLTTTTYYVNGATGSDTNPGTQTRPWKTIQKAANTVSAGATVIVDAGAYAQRVTVTRSGASGAPIKLQASGTVTMQGFTVTANYITIIGFTITNSINDDTKGVGIYVKGNNCDLENNYIHDMPRHGIMLYSPPTNYAVTSSCVVRNNRMYRASQAGLDVRGNNNLVESNDVSGTTQFPAVYVGPPTWADADGIRFFGTGNTFRSNYVHDIPVGTNENRNPHVDCFQTWADSSHLAATSTTIERNRCSNVQMNAQNSSDLGNGFQIKDASGLTIRNNAVYSDVGLLIYSSSGVNILNNVFASKVTTNASWYPVGAGLHNSTTMVLDNNIFFDQAAGIVVVDNTSLLAGKNLEYRSDGGSLSTSGGYNHSQDLWGVNPLFVNASSRDYHLQYGSPAKNTGLSLSNVINDYDGITRPQGGAYDIGAFEYH